LVSGLDSLFIGLLCAEFNETWHTAGSAHALPSS